MPINKDIGFDQSINPFPFLSTGGDGSRVLVVVALTGFGFFWQQGGQWRREGLGRGMQGHYGFCELSCNICYYL